MAALKPIFIFIHTKNHIRSYIKSSSKIKLQLENHVHEQIENDVLKPRQQPGIILSSSTHLPKQYMNALVRAIGDYSVKTLTNDGKRLNQYLASRHPPLEADDLHKKLKRTITDVDNKNPLPDLTKYNEIDAQNVKSLRERRINKLLKSRIIAWKPITYDTYESLVYAVGRSAKEYAILLKIFKEIFDRDPLFKPRSYFDFGAGVGTGMWAANTTWKELIYEYYNVDASRAMNDLSDLLLRGGLETGEHLFRNAYFRQFLPGIDIKYNLVVSAFTLFELPDAKTRKENMLNLWKKCNDYLVIVEEGSRKGSELINETRSYLMGLKDHDHKGYVFAPCPHDLKCPRLTQTDDKTPCNFQIHYEANALGEKSHGKKCAHYSYLILKKGNNRSSDQNWPRLVRPTLVRSKHVICRMCTEKGVLQEIIVTKSKHGKNTYRCAKASDWGDRLPVLIEENLEE